ncbi:hypothetical protein PPSIR1_24969 [Plesiocystis pacifica SIR-1]|uniref:Uncharacterized protein n=1 Tax=Plesiocystis pacifica SIR-1 TaxID=391625 RepID=A6G9I8_9BACT|nr:hypothetical protein [Plesiocystis pacifica]EDM77496.1 hypothetical protein PPSIR1_24969 [Plesiocystis pacifica SIR-1]
MAMFNVLRWYHPMIGCDWHIPVLPPGPLPAPSPYFVFHIMGNPLSLTKLYTTSVFADSTQQAMVKGSDIGMLIPHIGTFSVTIFVEMLFSGSKCHFGPAAIQVTDQNGGSGNPAAAIAVVANINLNCGFPVPTPLDAVLAFNTTAVGMTWADFLAGLYSMVLDFALQAALNWIGYKYMGWIGKGFQRLFNRIGPRLGIKSMSKAAAKATPGLRRAWRAANRSGAFKGTVNDYARMVAAKAGRNLNPVTRFVERHFALTGENVVNFFIGSPLGTAADAPAIGGPTAYSKSREQIDRVIPSEGAVHDFFDTPPPSSTPVDPSTPPTPEPTPADATRHYLNDSCVEEL